MAEPPTKRLKTSGPEMNHDARGQTSAMLLTVDRVQNHSSTYASDNAMVIQGNIIGDVNYHYHEATEQPMNDSETKDCRRLIDSLRYACFGERLRTVHSPLPKTCNWLFETTEFRSWVDRPNAFTERPVLLIKGKLGCGKSTIMGNALAWMKQHRSQRTVVAYFYNARSKYKLNQSSLGMYRSLIYQLLRAIPASRGLFLNKFLDKLKPGDKVEAWKEAELRKYLREFITQNASSRLTIFVDALDEGGVDHALQLAADFEDLSLHAQTQGIDLRICLSSRHFPEINMTRGLFVELVVEKQHSHHEDIKLYVDTKLHGDQSPQMNELRQELCDKAQGVFLWVVLVVRMLNEPRCRAKGLSRMRALLRTNPDHLDELFAKILSDNLGGMDMDPERLSLFQWVIFSLRPLQPVELFHAVQSSCQPLAPADLEQWAVVDYSSYVLHYSCGLVELTAAQPFTVQFVHESVREFFLSSSGQRFLSSVTFSNNLGDSNETLKVGCARYIQHFFATQLNSPRAANAETQPATMRPRIDRKVAVAQTTAWPFLEYAARNVLLHAERAQEHGVGQLDYMKSLLSSKEIGFKAVVQLENAWETPAYRYQKYRVPLSLVFFAKANLVNLAKIALEEQLVDECAACGSNGRESNRGSSKVRNRVGEIAICVALDLGHKDFAELLCQWLSATDISWGNVLWTAARQRHESIIQLILDKGIHPDTRAENSPTAMVAACENGHAAVVSMLLRYGANPNLLLLQDIFEEGVRWDYSLLDRASTSGCQDTVNALLEAGATPGFSGDVYEGSLLTALANLICSADKGRYEHVIHLLSNGHDGQIESGKYSFSEHQSCSALDAVLKILLRSFDATAGCVWADINWQLYAECVQVLLKRGAYISEQSFWQILEVDEYCMRFRIVQKLCRISSLEVDLVEEDADSLTPAELERLFPDIEADGFGHGDHTRDADSDVDSCSEALLLMGIGEQYSCDGYHLNRGTDAGGGFSVL